MYFILKTKYTLSIEFVPAQVRSNNHWRTSPEGTTKNLELSHPAFPKSIIALLVSAINERIAFLLTNHFVMYRGFDGVQ